MMPWAGQLISARLLGQRQFPASWQLRRETALPRRSSSAHRSRARDTACREQWKRRQPEIKSFLNLECNLELIVGGTLTPTDTVSLLLQGNRDAVYRQMP